MPSSSRYSRPSISGSPPLTSPAYSVSHATTVGQQKLNVVTRLAIEGRAERGANGAAIKMYLKISLPLDGVTPGSSIPLFPEENLKILDSQVHPLDGNSAPYNFSSVTSPLLQKAARALNLPARSAQSYLPTDTNVSSSDLLPPLDERYTGQILVSSYHVSFILPKEFPRREVDPRSKRPSVVAQFMAAIDLWVPLLTQPPHAPYLLSIPLPRCLSNHMRLKIFPPNSQKTSASTASLSSADDNYGAWEMTSDPHVTRSTSARLSRSHSYNNFADDESSDASTSAGFPDGCGIQGSFPSSDRIRIRWAKPIRPEELPQTMDGRRRVGIREVKASMSCSILGAGRESNYGTPEGVVMRLQYEATCKGIWFPGVATLLGLDVGLDAEDCDVSWVSGLEHKWTIGGDVGFMGYATGPPPTPPLSRQSSVDNPSIYVLPSSPNGRAATNGHAPMRFDSSSSTSSLLRAPLPAQNVADYSFETSPSSTPISSLASLPIPSSPENDRRSRASSLNGRATDVDTDYEEDAPHLPKVPITMHINMNDLLPPAKQDFKFRISGTVLVTPRKPVLVLSSRRYKSSPNASRHPSDDETEPDVVVVPRFRVLCADKEHISCTIQSDVNDAMIDVYNSVGDIRNAQTRKTVLQKGGQVKCGTDGARIALRPVKRSPSPPARARMEESIEVSRRSRSRHRAPNGASYREPSPSIVRQSFFTSSMRIPVQRDGPLLIPSVNVTVTPLLKENTTGSPDYAVRLDLPAPTEEDMEWLEFGLAHPNLDSKASVADEAPKIEVVSASLEGVSVRFITSPVVKPEISGTVPFGESSGKQWVTWVRVHLGDACGGKVEIIYLVRGKQEPTEPQPLRKGKGPAPELVTVSALLPSFSLPVSVLEVNVLLKSGFEIVSTKTNLSIERPVPQGLQLVHYALEEYFHPHLAIELAPSALSSPSSRPAVSLSRRAWTVGWFQVLLTFTSVLISLISVLSTRSPIVGEPPSASIQPVPISEVVSSEAVSSTLHVTAAPTEIITETTTAAASSTRWYFPDPDTASQVEVPTAVDTTASASSTSSSPTFSSTASFTPYEPQLDFWHNLVMMWRLRLELPTIKLPNFTAFRMETASEVLHRLLDSAGSAWDLLQWPANKPEDPAT